MESTEVGPKSDSINLRERLFFYIVFVILIILMLLMIKPFFTILVVSLISVIMLKPVYNFYLGRKTFRNRTGLAASVTLITLLVGLIIPVVLIVWVAANQLSGLFEQLANLDLAAIAEEIRESLQALPWVGEAAEPDLSAAESGRPLARAVAEGLADFVVGLGSSLPSLFVQGIIFLIVVATLLPVYDTLIPKLEEISPLGREMSEIYTRKFTAMIKSLVLGVFLIAIIQGAAMGVFFWIAGLNYVFLLTLLSMLLAMIPMVGISWLVIAIAVLSVLTGNWAQAAIVLLGFYGVVNWIDLLLRPKLIAQEASINFALFMVALFGGLAWAGIMGLFYGPVIMLLLVTTIEIYAERYAHEDRSLLGEALGRLDSDRETAAPEAAESGARAGAEAADSMDPNSHDQASDA